MLKAVFSYIYAVIQVVAVLLGGVKTEIPADNGVIDVVFDSVNGSKPSTSVAQSGDLLVEPEMPSRRGLVFDGWYADGKKWDFETDTVKADTTLTAKWKLSENIFENDPNAGIRTEDSDLRVMSFNVLASDWNNKPAVAGRDDLLRDVVSRYKPDVMGFQELNQEWYDSLGENFGSYRLVNADNNKIGRYVNYSTLAYNCETVTLVKWGQKAFTVNYNENCRNLMWAVFELKAQPGKRFIVTSTHWDLTSERRVAQAIEMSGLIKLLEARYGLPMFCTGDYNAKEPSDEYYAFTKITGFKSSKYSAESRGLACVTAHLGDGTGTAEDYTSGYWKLGTVSFRQKHIDSVESIDHIFVTPETSVLYYDTVVDAAALSASDHCPIYIDVSL